MAKKYIVTGGTSFIATGLLKVMAEDRKNKICVVVRPDSKRLDRLGILNNSEAEILTVPCDLNNIARLSRLAEGRWDCFIHLGWETSGRDDREKQERNSIYASECVKTAKKMGCTKFLGIGSQAEYGLANKELTEESETNPVTEYGKEKLHSYKETKKLCRELGIDHVWARILSVYGTLDAEKNFVNQMILKMLNFEKANMSGGEQIWDYMHIDDCGEALYLLAERGKSGEVYNVASGESKPLRAYAEDICKEIFGDDTDADEKIAFGALPYRQDSPMILKADISKLKKDTGFTPKREFRQGIKEIVQYYRSNAERYGI